MLMYDLTITTLRFVASSGGVVLPDHEQSLPKQQIHGEFSGIPHHCAIVELLQVKKQNLFQRDSSAPLDLRDIIH